MSSSHGRGPLAGKADGGAGRSREGSSFRCGMEIQPGSGEELRADLAAAHAAPAWERVSRRRARGSGRSQREETVPQPDGARG